MSAVNNFIFKAKQVVSVATQKTGDAVEISKLRLQVAQTNSMIQSTYERVGTLVYDKEKNGSDNSQMISECVFEIDSLLVKLGELNEKISALKTGEKCSYCQTMNPAGTIYCSSCGTNLKKRKIL